MQIKHRFRGFNKQTKQFLLSFSFFFFFDLLQWRGNQVCSGHRKVSHFQKVMVIEALVSNDSPWERHWRGKTEEIYFAGFWYSACQVLRPLSSPKQAIYPSFSVYGSPFTFWNHHLSLEIGPIFIVNILKST